MVPDVGQDHKRRKWQDQPIRLGKCLCPEGCRAWAHRLGKNRISPGQSQRVPPGWTLGSLDNESKKWLEVRGLRHMSQGNNRDSPWRGGK